MSQPRIPKPAKLVVSLLVSQKCRLDPVAEALSNRFGPLDVVSSWWPFAYTTYYRAEMGTPLWRRMLAFSKLIRQDALADIKLFTNTVEQRCLANGGRSVNIDPGYLLHERFVLASGKNFTHRIYIGQGIYADLTLIYTGGGFKTLPWTYPDYAATEMLTYLTRVRSKYGIDLKQQAM